MSISLKCSVACALFRSLFTFGPSKSPAAFSDLVERASCTYSAAMSFSRLPLMGARYGFFGREVISRGRIPSKDFLRMCFSFNPSEAVQFETGAYWLDTMAEWPVLESSVAQELSFELH